MIFKLINYLNLLNCLTIQLLEYLIIKLYLLHFFNFFKYFYYFIILLFYYFIILLFYYFIILLFYYFIILLFYYFIILLIIQLYECLITSSSGCWSEFLLCHHSRAPPKDVRSVLRVQENPQRNHNVSNCCTFRYCIEFYNYYLLWKVYISCNFYLNASIHNTLRLIFLFAVEQVADTVLRRDKPP